MKTVYLSGILSAWINLVVAHCPPQASIVPCTCNQIEDGISIHCKGPGETERIVSVIQDIRSSRNLELVLESLTLPVLPNSVNLEVSSLRLYDVKISNKSSVTWPKLNDVVIESSTIKETPWAYFKGGKLLRHLKVSNMEIPRIGSEFREGVPATVGYLDIRKTRTSTLESHAMSHLKKLKYLLMVDVPLQQFPRDALPQEMPDLHTFILGNTQIGKLETGFFEGMPKLEVLMLNGNKLSTLDYHLFAPVENHLTHLLAERNPLVCDCNLVWLTNDMQKKGSLKVLATCTEDDTHTRKEVTTLDNSEYCS